MNARIQLARLSRCTTHLVYGAKQTGRVEGRIQAVGKHLRKDISVILNNNYKKINLIKIKLKINTLNN